MVQMVEILPSKSSIPSCTKNKLHKDMMRGGPVAMQIFHMKQP
jgi:hypothetical protein